MTKTRQFSISKVIIGFEKIILLSFMVLMILYSKEVKVSIIEGAKLALTNIIPTLFPFFVISDLCIHVFEEKKKSFASKTFEKLFGFPSVALTPYLFGIFLGFPLGIKCACELYREGLLDKKSTERLIGTINNPSAAYVISGVGLGLFRSLKTGILLFLSVTLSSILIGVLFRRKAIITNITVDKPRQNFSLSESIVKAGSNSINILSYIIFFSAINGIIFATTKNRLATTLLSPLFEVSGAVNNIFSYADFPIKTRLCLVALALGFSGFSVHFQAFSFLPQELSRTSYLYTKMLQGLFSFLLMYIFLLRV